MPKTFELCDGAPAGAVSVALAQAARLACDEYAQEAVGISDKIAPIAVLVPLCTASRQERSAR